MSPTEAPSAWVEQSRVLEVHGARMPAVLCAPADRDPDLLVLIVPGSLFLDADGNMPAFGSFTHVYADLAHQLAERGVASLRHAKLGPGTGSEIVDAEAAAAHRHFLTRTETESAALEMATHEWPGLPAVVAGHSEGAVVASLVAALERRVAAVVSLSGPSVGLLDIMREQLTVPTEAGYARFDHAVAEIRAGRPLPAGLDADPTTAGLAWVGPANAPFLVEIDRVDPRAAIAGFAQPVLLVQGGRDASVAPHHLERLLEARGARPTESARFETLQHFYKQVPDGMDPRAAFALDGESDPAVAEAIVAWARRTLSPGARR